MHRGNEMKSKLYCKILAIGIIILFIGVGIHPAFAVDTKQSMTIKASEEDCGCNEVDDRQLVVLEKQLTRMEVYSKLLLVLSRFNPELKEISEELVDGISTLSGIFEEIETSLTFDDRLICQILDYVYYEIVRLSDYYIDLGNKYYEYNIFLTYFFVAIGGFFYFLQLPILDQFYYFNCPPPAIDII
jgi:hypothetical protein